MATLSKNILPIPESVVVGSGSYTVPANKYGYICFSSRSTIGAVVNLNFSSYTSAADSGNQWISAGTSISTSVSAPTGTFGVSGGATYTFEASATVSLNGTSVNGALTRAVVYSSNTLGSLYSSNAAASWSVSLFPIPIDNLPTALTT